MTGFSTMDWQCDVTVITLSATLRLRVPHFYLETMYSGMNGYLDFRPFTQACLPSGNFTGEGAAYFEVTDLYSNMRVQLYVNLITNVVSIRTLTIEGLTFDSIFIHLGPEFVIGGSTVDWDAFNENFPTCFATQLATHKGQLQEKVMVSLNGIITQFTLQEFFDLVSSGDCPICSFMSKAGEKGLLF